MYKCLSICGANPEELHIYFPKDGREMQQQSAGEKLIQPKVTAEQIESACTLLARLWCEQHGLKLASLEIRRDVLDENKAAR